MTDIRGLETQICHLKFQKHTTKPQMLIPLVTECQCVQFCCSFGALASVPMAT